MAKKVAKKSTHPRSRLSVKRKDLLTRIIRELANAQQSQHDMLVELADNQVAQNELLDQLAKLLEGQDAEIPKHFLKLN